MTYTIYSSPASGTTKHPHLFDLIVFIVSNISFVLHSVNTMLWGLEILIFYLPACNTFK